MRPPGSSTLNSAQEHLREASRTTRYFFLLAASRRCTPLIGPQLSPLSSRKPQRSPNFLSVSLIIWKRNVTVPPSSRFKSCTTIFVPGSSPSADSPWASADSAAGAITDSRTRGRSTNRPTDFIPLLQHARKLILHEFPRADNGRALAADRPHQAALRRFDARYQLV